MALKSKSLFLYGYTVTPLNSSLDFRAVSAGPILQATLRLGDYSLTSLMNEISRAMMETDPDHEYVVTADRTIAGGTQNRVTIAIDQPLVGDYLDLLFGSGPRVASSIGQLVGFNPIDRTGAQFYQGNTSSGTLLMTQEVGYGFVDPRRQKKVFGSVNVSASGKKEAIVHALQKFLDVSFKYEPESKALTQWQDFFEWGIQQKLFDFTPEIADPATIYEVTFERTQEESKGLGFQLNEMLPNFPGLYETGMLQFRLNEA